MTVCMALNKKTTEISKTFVTSKTYHDEPAFETAVASVDASWVKLATGLGPKPTRHTV